MGVCDAKKIKQNLKRCGQKALAKGVNELIYIGMRDEQSIAFTFDSTNTTILTAIAMGTSQKLFAYEGKNYSNDPSVGFNRTDFDLTLPQTMVIVLFSNSPATKLEMEALFTRKDLVLIYERVSGDFEAMGVGAGMQVTNFVYRPNDDNKGAFVVTLTGADEVDLPKTVRHVTSGTDDTRVYLAGLVAADA
ncbi:hypothetical protein GO755_29625 [Spirosoma sp. HMF4905]|uniref:Uncharacterized protein n=1 Tax=Spirosoma arboris TaxID=2682092 RepID=A0A7K1SK93_9BACT|nr:hypothetical protein [Spirosoma arboris]MVM34227.1 hypothetical protein [Spirosoma arboris]